MTIADEFFDFAVFWELMFGEEDEGFECPLCSATIKRGTTLEFIDEQDRTFLCPECDGSLKLNEVTGTVEQYDEEEGAGEKGEETKRSVIPDETEHEKLCRKKLVEFSRELDVLGIRFPIGQLKSQNKFIVRGASFYLDLVKIDLKARQKNEAIAEMVALFTEAGLLRDGKEFYANLRWREEIAPTGIGHNIALPQAFADIDANLLVAVGISKEGVEFDALDSKPVKIILMTAGKKMDANIPNSGVYLKALALIVRFIKSDENRQRMINAGSREELFSFLRDNMEAFTKR